MKPETGTCQVCGSELERVDCWNCEGNGEIPLDELTTHDPVFDDAYDLDTCPICDGDGGYWVCPDLDGHDKNDYDQPYDSI